MFERAKKIKIKKDSLLTVDINDAIRIKDYLNKISEGSHIGIVTKEDKGVFQLASRLIETLINIYGMWSNSKKRIDRLLKIIFGNRSEKTKKTNQSPVHPGGIKQDGEGLKPSVENNPNTGTSEDSALDKKATESDSGPELAIKPENEPVPEKEKRKGGGGKNGSDKYTAAAEIICKLDDKYLPGETCPECKKGKLFEIDPKKVIRLAGQAPVTAFKFFLQQTRCICGAFFTADVGNDFRDIYEAEKYSPSALAAIIIHKFLTGISFGTLARIAANEWSSSSSINSGKQNKRYGTASNSIDNKCFKISRYKFWDACFR